MARRGEAPAGRAARARRIVAALRRLYPDADCALAHASAFELLVATILSAQTRDERVNQVTPALFRRYPDARALAQAETGDLERAIRPTGFFRAKSRALQALGRALVERHRGEVPARMEELVELPGVGRKTASVVLGTWFGQPAIPVDTHVTRVAQRLGLTESAADPVAIERDLAALIPASQWTFAAHALIWHGRRVCAARRPACARCALRGDCPFPALA